MNETDQQIISMSKNKIKIISNLHTNNPINPIQMRIVNLMKIGN